MKLAISVIIPTYNLEKYILTCLESLKNQTLSQDLFEVIVADDGSTDKTVLVAQGFHDIQNFRVLTCFDNRGPGIARNKGVKAARGKYILFLDGDDCLEHHALATLYRNMKDGFDAFVYNWTFADDADKTPRKRDFPYITADKGTFIKNYLGMSVSGEVIFTVVKKEIFEKHNIIFPESYHEDIFVIFKMLFLSSTIKKLQDDVLYLKLNRKGSIVNTLTFQHIEGYLGSWPDIMCFLMERDNTAVQKYLNDYRRGINGLVFTLIYKCLHSIDRKDLEARKRIYNDVFRVLQKDKYIKDNQWDVFPKQTKKDISAHEYYRLMSENNLSDEVVLAFENKAFGMPPLPVEVVKL
jgi:poly(ribitol-phosphate) beta-N-acetylglucosaminyltransferase